MNIFIKSLSSIFSFKPKNNQEILETVSASQVESGLDHTIKNYGEALKGLEKYDKGELPEADNMVKRTTLRGYLRSI